MKSILKSLKSMAVTVAAVFLMAAIFALPVPTASAATPRDVGLRGRYVLSATVSQQNLLHTMDSKGIYRDVLYCFFDDENGDAWCYAYECADETVVVPPMNQSVTLIMNSNGTPDDIDDDIIEDILWCNCENAAEED